MPDQTKFDSLPADLFGLVTIPKLPMERGLVDNGVVFSDLKGDFIVDEQRIWAPWRIGYVAGKDQSEEPMPAPSAWRDGADQSCFLCRAAANYQEMEIGCRQNLVVETGPHTVSLLNKYPYTNGHLLVAPLRHVGGLAELSDDEHLEIMQTLGRLTQLLQELITADGFNVGLNLGSVAGAGVPGHLHWHLVPRWQGDNNFMPTLAGVRMIPQSLEALWEAIVAGRSGQEVG